MSKQMSEFTPETLAICVGAQKSGTSWLYKCLEEHPDICTANGKETNYFLKSDDDNGYVEFFQHCRKKRIYFEASPLYLPSADAPKNIRKYRDDAKIIILLRNPVDRTLSHYKHLLSKKVPKVSNSLTKTIKNRPDLIRHSKYSIDIERYKKMFPSSQLLLIDYEKIKTEPQTVINEVCDFLKIDSYVPKFLHTKYNTNMARSNPFYNRATMAYLSVKKYRYGNYILALLRKLKINSASLEKSLSFLSDKNKNVTISEEDITYLKKVLGDDINFYNHVFE